MLILSVHDKGLFHRFGRNDNIPLGVLTLAVRGDSGKSWSVAWIIRRSAGFIGSRLKGSRPSHLFRGPLGYADQGILTAAAVTGDIHNDTDACFVTLLATNEARY